MERILQNTAATISATFSVDGEVPDPTPTAATVQVLRSDGSDLVASTDATDEEGGEFSFVLTREKTAALDTLEARWTAEIDSEESTITTRFEVVGGFYFTIGEFRSRFGVKVEGESSDDIAAARATAEDIIEGLGAEDGCNVAFVPRAEVFTLVRGDSLQIPRYHLRSVEWATAGGDELDIADLLIEGSLIYGARGLRGPVVAQVTHGLDQPPSRIKEAAMLLAFNRLVEGPIDSRAIGVPTDGGVVPLLTPGLRGSVTGIPEVDAAIKQYRKRPIRPTSAWIGERNLSSPSSWREGVWP